MDPHAKRAAAQALLGITLLLFVPLIAVSLLVPLRNARNGSRRR